MEGKWFLRIVALIVFSGIVACPLAFGSHIDSNGSSPGPPQLPQPQQDKNLVIPIQKTPVSLSVNNVPPVTGPQTTFMENRQEDIDFKPHSKLGWRFLLNGQTQAALAAYRQALRKNPKSAQAYLGLGISLKSLGEIELAKKALLKSVNLNPRLPSALVHLGYLYADGHFGQSELSTAHRLFQEASQLGDPFATIALAELKSPPGR